MTLFQQFIPARCRRFPTDADRHRGSRRRATYRVASEIYCYGIFPEAEDRLAEHGMRLHRLCAWQDLLDAARAEGKFDPETPVEVEAFLSATRDWQQVRTGA